MKLLTRNSGIFFIVLAGTLIGLFKGSEARQKWVFKIKDKYDNRRQAAKQKSIARKGGVILDEIEMASYHR